jgi:DNA-binding beta-propeller fold protein YncE
MSPDGQKLVATCSMGGQILLLDAANGALIQAFNVGGAPRRITFTADGLLALVTDEFGFVHIIR